MKNLLEWLWIIGIILMIVIGIPLALFLDHLRFVVNV